jgi:hypothetical protein
MRVGNSTGSSRRFAGRPRSNEACLVAPSSDWLGPRASRPQMSAKREQFQSDIQAKLVCHSAVLRGTPAVLPLRLTQSSSLSPSHRKVRKALRLGACSCVNAGDQRTVRILSVHDALGIVVSWVLKNHFLPGTAATFSRDEVSATQLTRSL